MAACQISRRSILQAALTTALAGHPTASWAQHLAKSGSGADLVQAVRDAAELLPALDAPSFGQMFDRFGSSRVVLLGEASHGTSEFYRARAAITRRLIEHHGFTIVALEADWPDAAHINAYVRDERKPSFPARPFQAFPTWMWPNEEMRAFIDWLRDHNSSASGPLGKTGVYGLDLYNLSASMDMVNDHLTKSGSPVAAEVRQHYQCLAPYRDDPSAYGASLFGLGGGTCDEEVEAALKALSELRTRSDTETSFDALQNARAVASGERYYRTAGSTNSWNLRDRHMFDTLLNVLEARGPDSKAVVWAHNSHVGNAAATEMTRRGELNIGELCRKHFGSRAALIGFDTDRGTVMAASQWGAQPEVKTVRPSLPESYGAVFRDAHSSPFLLDLRRGVHDSLRHALGPERLERAIGVMYLPETERVSHYFMASLPEQFDAFLFFAETQAVKPITRDAGASLPDEHPFAQ